MPVMSNSERDEFLATPGILMRIATVRPDGSPLVTPIWFVAEDGAIWYTPREHSEWFACLRHDPRVALCIDEQPLPYRKVVVEGHAELVHDLGADAEWRELYRRIARRYVPKEAADAYIEDTIDQPRGLFRTDLDASTVRCWRMPVGDESGTGIWHNRYYADGSKMATRDD